MKHFMLPPNSLHATTDEVLFQPKVQRMADTRYIAGNCPDAFVNIHLLNDYFGH
jgi:hypothetical protein